MLPLSCTNTLPTSQLFDCKPRQTTVLGYNSCSQTPCLCLIYYSLSAFCFLSIKDSVGLTITSLCSKRKEHVYYDRKIIQTHNGRWWDKAGVLPEKGACGEEFSAFSTSVSGEVMNPLIPPFSKVTRWFQGSHERDATGTTSLMWERIWRVVKMRSYKVWVYTRNLTWCTKANSKISQKIRHFSGIDNLSFGHSQGFKHTLYLK